MSRAKLTAVSLERFKSFAGQTRLDLQPLTIVLGRNNSGKSSLIQSILLLKQTLNDPRSEVGLKLDGIVDAFNLRELTYGWPESAPRVEGPSFTVEWESDVDIDAALAIALNPDRAELAKNTGVKWLESPPASKTLKTSLKVCLCEIGGVTQLTEILLVSDVDGCVAEFRLELDNKGAWKCYWNNDLASKLEVELEHFIPYVKIDRRNIGPRSRQRSWQNAYTILFSQPLTDLVQLLSEFYYLGSSRLPPSSLYKPATTPPNEIGVNGEFAAQMLHRRQNDKVHFLPPARVEGDKVVVDSCVQSQTMSDAVNAVLKGLSIDAPVSIKEVQDVGFRLFFGDASIQHVGRGLNSLLPLIELGLFADPMRFKETEENLSLSKYQIDCSSFGHIALEEPEAHLHPKVASRLAHLLVSLAMSNRRLIVETHSDHLVRRLRGLASRAGKNSELEEWLLNNVTIVSVEQGDDGQSKITQSRLTAEGGMEEMWPADFMDAATDEESTIYYTRLEKTTDQDVGNQIKFNAGVEPEIDESP